MGRNKHNHYPAQLLCYMSLFKRLSLPFIPFDISKTLPLQISSLQEDQTDILSLSQNILNLYTPFRIHFSKPALKVSFLFRLKHLSFLQAVINVHCSRTYCLRVIAGNILKEPPTSLESSKRGKIEERVGDGCGVYFFRSR